MRRLQSPRLNREEIFERAYKTSESTANPEEVLPKERVEVPEGVLTLPKFFNTVNTLDQVIDVDYYLPGCAPPPDLIMNAVTAILEGKLPGKGAVLAPKKTLCDECERNDSKPDKLEITEFKRVYETEVAPDECFLAQGIICMGIATRAGCGERCINANMPCRGCFGPTEDVMDFGLKAMSGIASIFAVENEKDIPEEEMQKLLDKVVDPDGNEFAKFKAQDYLNHIDEHVEKWSYIKFPYLKNVGWNGFTDGKDSGVYRVAPLARVNAADGMATPKAQVAYDKMYEVLGGKPAHNTLAFHWTRLVEQMYAAERLLELAQDDEIISDDIRNIPTEKPNEGVGVIEAPRGTLFHHYKTDDKGLIQKANLIVATLNNSAAISMSIKKAAENLIKNGEVSEGILNMVEMAFRAYDPCMACATHSLPGETPIKVDIYDADKNIVKTLVRD